MTIAEWAERNRMVPAESGTPHPGRWENGRMPHLIEIMEVMSLDDPCTEVAHPKGNQSGGTEVLLNAMFFHIDHRPVPMLYVLPSVDGAKLFNKTKLATSIEATPAVRRKVVETKSRDAKGSTTTFKRFPGGYLVVAGANSSKGLKMYSARIAFMDEVTEFPFDVDGQGDPVSLVEKRNTAFQRQGYKRVYNSTPGLKGTCRVTAKYEDSDMRRRYVRCPHCGAYQVLLFRNMRWRSDTWPHGAYFVCATTDCGGVIEQYHKDELLRGDITERAIRDLGRSAASILAERIEAGTLGAVWIKTYPGEDQPPLVIERTADIVRALLRPRRGQVVGFHSWQAYNRMGEWDEIVKDHLEARGKPAKLKDFTRQSLGEAWEEAVDVPDHVELVKRVESYRLGGMLPNGVLFLTGAADVQHNRIEWAVYGWGIGLTYWLVDKGIIEGDPNDASTWSRLDPVWQKRYSDALGRKWPIDVFGVDTGYLSTKVYMWVRRWAGTERVFALDGRAGWKLPAIGTPAVKDVDYEGQKIGSVVLWPVGTYDMKSEHYASLRKVLSGPDKDGKLPEGIGHFPDACDEAYFKQLTAEHIRQVFDRKGYPIKEWAKRNKDQPNEALDIAVYARALAHHVSDALGPDEWSDLVVRRAAEPREAQLGLDQYWAGLAAGAAPAEDPDESDGQEKPPEPAIVAAAPVVEVTDRPVLLDPDRARSFMAR